MSHIATQSSDKAMPFSNIMVVHGHIEFYNKVYIIAMTCVHAAFMVCASAHLIRAHPYISMIVVPKRMRAETYE